MPASTRQATTVNVVRRESLATAPLFEVVEAFGLEIVDVDRGRPIPGSYWGAPEAGLVSDRLYACADTPVHSILHETSHFVCMSAKRRARLHTDAGGSALEEAAVCFLSVILAAEIPGFGCRRMLADMDSWGYGFRLGSARLWFERDADDAREWLLARGLITHEPRPTWRLRY